MSENGKSYPQEGWRPRKYFLSPRIETNSSERLSKPDPAPKVSTGVLHIQGDVQPKVYGTLQPPFLRFIPFAQTKPDSYNGKTTLPLDYLV
jgi:hypothetical protein